jgi:hypothetical protein
VEATASGIQDSVNVLGGLFNRVPQVVMSSAQSTDHSLELFMALVGADKARGLVKYIHTGSGPLVELVPVRSPDAIRAIIWDTIRQGGRIAVYCSLPTTANNLSAWVQKMVGVYNSSSTGSLSPIARPTVAWTGAWLTEMDRRPARDATGFMQVNNIYGLFYTNGLSEGMDVNNELGFWTARAMYLERGGAGPGTAGQMAGRIRQIKDPRVYVYSSAYGQQADGSAEVDHDKVAMAQVLKNFPHERYMTLNAAGACVVDVKEGHVNTFRLASAYEASKRKYTVTVDDLVEHMDNARVVADDATPDAPPCAVWTRMIKEQSAALTPTANFTNQELADLARDQIMEGTPGESMKRATRYNHIANTLPPWLVGAKAFTTGHGLTLAALSLVESKFCQLRTLQKLARGLTDDEDTARQRQSLLEQFARMNDQNTFDSLVESDQVALVIRAMLMAVGVENIDLSLLTDNGNNNDGEDDEQDDATVMQIATPANPVTTKSSAYRWLGKHWKRVATMTSHNNRLDGSAPATVADAMSAALKLVLREKVGISLKEGASGKLCLVPWGLFRKMKIDVTAYSNWYTGPEAHLFGILPTNMVECDECDGASGITRCLRQNGRYLCLSPQTAMSNTHRELHQPLDVGVLGPGGQQQQQQQQHQHDNEDEEMKEAAGVVESTPLDVLLEWMGFQGGMESIAKLTCKQMQQKMQGSGRLARQTVHQLETEYDISVTDDSTASGIIWKGAQKVRRHGRVLSSHRLRGNNRTRPRVWSVSAL